MSILGLLFVLMISSSSSDGEFVGRRGTEFVWNGSEFLFNGFNAYWMMQVAEEASQKHIVPAVFLEASRVALGVCRIWAFSDGGDRALQKSPGVYDERFFQALDFVVAEAGKHNMKLIMSLINNYVTFGGRHQYVEWARSGGASLASDDDFYTHPLVKGYYKNNAKYAALESPIQSYHPTWDYTIPSSRLNGVAYKDDPTIMAWELINEPRCEVDTSGQTIGRWIQEMGSYVKSIDNKHLVTVGMEGFYSTPDRVQYNPKSLKYGTDFINNNLIPYVDFATIHAYPAIWLAGESEKTQMEFLKRWLTIHWTDSKSILKKPLVFGEFGKSSKDPGFSIKQRDAFMTEVYASIYNLAKSGRTIAGGLVWQIGGEGMDSYFDGYEVVLTLNPSTREIIRNQSNNMISLGQPYIKEI
ncbi:mannan endo-1,4-beta-mannosidase 5-like [Neltuma alba]|uniref:mannan endo-1,4-beta-mannosidase 5-like n=1 Tax=Neltuma alba TaxID=207710 RepID=UPI0010A43523|nr:mannan endo-1,4-beta-mannosidase 5-like [Prosopis alba]